MSDDVHNTTVASSKGVPEFSLPYLVVHRSTPQQRQAAYMVMNEQLGYLLLPSYSNHASPYRITNATKLPATCTVHKTFTNLSSLIGPSLTSSTFKIVRFVVLVILPVVLSTSRRTSPSVLSIRRMRAVSGDGVFSSTATEGCRRFA